MKLTGKMIKFCYEYPKDFNATKAAERAGYSKKTAYAIGLMDRYQESIAKGVRYLVERRRLHEVMFQDTFDLGPGEIHTRHGYKWHSGLFFFGFFWDLATRRSEG